jgi:hypothetical protein
LAGLIRYSAKRFPNLERLDKRGARLFGVYLKKAGIVSPSRFASAYRKARENIEGFGEIFEAPIVEGIANGSGRRS